MVLLDKNVTILLETGEKVKSETPETKEPVPMLIDTMKKTDMNWT